MKILWGELVSKCAAIYCNCVYWTFHLFDKRVVVNDSARFLSQPAISRGHTQPGEIWRNNPNGWPPARFAYEKLPAVNRYTFIMPEHLLISRFSPPVSLASSLPGEVGNIFDFRGKKRRAGRSGKGRGKGARRMPEAWNNNCRIFALHHSTSIFKMTRPSFSCSLSLFHTILFLTF